MEAFNKSFNQSSFSNDTRPEEIPVFVTYLSMVALAISVVVITTPALTIINVIWQTRSLHTKYFFFLAHLLAINVTGTLATTIGGYLIMTLYLLDLNSGPANVIMKWLVILPDVLLHLMSILFPINLAVERMVAIVFPFRHRSIMTTKKTAGMLAVTWGVSAILAITITVTVPFDIIWPLAFVKWDIKLIPFGFIARVTSILSIVVANVFLQYKITLSNRKAKENERLGNEEEVQRFRKFIQEVRAQAKATLTLFLAGGIDVMGNILIPVIYTIIATIEPSKQIYVLRFSMINIWLLLSQILVYGLYMKKIRKRLPKWTNCHQLWITRHNRVGILHQQQ